MLEYKEQKIINSYNSPTKTPFFVFAQRFRLNPIPLGGDGLKQPSVDAFLLPSLRASVLSCN